MAKKTKSKNSFNLALYHENKSLTPSPDIILKSLILSFLLLIFLFFDFFVVTSKEISNFEVLNNFEALENR